MYAAITASRKFTIVGRQDLKTLLDEQDLGQSGVVNQESAAQLGEVKGAKYKLVTVVDHFQEETARLGLEAFAGAAVASLHVADFDMDCDPDAVVALEGGGLRYLRNDGGDAHAQVKVQLVGNRSNASGIGCKVEIETGGGRVSTASTVQVAIAESRSAGLARRPPAG